MKAINIYYNDIPEIKLKKRRIYNIINRIIVDHNRINNGISVIFADDEYLFDLNVKFLGHDYYTDIITFNNNMGDKISGELYISVDRVKENAQKINIIFIDELLRVIIHGILHLVGYNDKNESDTFAMREKEDYYLNIYKEEK